MTILTTYRDSLRRAIVDSIADAVGGSPWAPDLEAATTRLVAAADRAAMGDPVLADLLKQHIRRGGEDDDYPPF